MIMNQTWTADITNDPDQDFDLCIEIYQGDAHRGTILRDASGALVMTIYPSPQAFQMPAQWLAEVLQSAARELPAT